MSTFEVFAALHVPGDPFVLVNAWDVASALILADAGHPAIGTTSLGVTAAAGLLDGVGAGRELTVELVGRLSGRLGVPLSVDLENGYSEDPRVVAELVGRLGALGVAGVNLEDAGRSPEAHAGVVAAVRAANPEVFLNARIDEHWSGGHDLVTALERARAYRDAGAHGLFVPGLTDPAGIGAVADLGLPVNVLWQPGGGLRSTSAARISTGSALYRAAISAGAQAADAARARRPPAPTIGYDAVQDLLRGAGRG